MFLTMINKNMMIYYINEIAVYSKMSVTVNTLIPKFCHFKTNKLIKRRCFEKVQQLLMKSVFVLKVKAAGSTCLL